MNKNILILLAIVFSTLTVGTGCTKADINNSASSDEDNLSFTERNNQMYVSAVIVHGVKIVTTKTGTTTVETKDYGTAKGIYGENGFRFQFVDCSGKPGFLTMKLGVKFMIDNRDNKSHQIAIGAKTYKLEAYDFAIVSIQKIGDFIITCDGGGAAHVLIQS
jgi:hypothetical protein